MKVNATHLKATHLKRMFVAPDPGRVRLRTAARAALGVALAVAVAETAGLPLTASIMTGVATLVAFFVVADPTPRRQALTTVLLPVAGLPALALASVLHGLPLLRDMAFLAVIFGGVYARRWGPRGQAIGVFPYMMFFMAQLLHVAPAAVARLSLAVLLGTLVTLAVRYVLWPIERRTPPRRVPAPAPARGLARGTTRQAFQAVAAATAALVIGQAVSPDRWYWAVAATWWAFLNTSARGETMVRGFRRVVGTFAGVLAGLLIAVPLEGAVVPSAVLIILCVFGLFYSAGPSHSWQITFVTLMASLAYGLLGILTPTLLGVRLGLTAIGAVAAALAVLLVLPVTTHATTDAWIQRAVRCVHDCTTHATRRLAGPSAVARDAGPEAGLAAGPATGPAADPSAHIAELELLLERVRGSVAPLLHPLSPFRHRKARARQVVALLDECGRHVRGLTEVAADPAASHDARLTAACARVAAAVHALTVPGTSWAPAAAHPTPKPHSGAERALAHLHALESALAALTHPLHTPLRTPHAPS